MAVKDTSPVDSLPSSTSTSSSSNGPNAGVPSSTNEILFATVTCAKVKKSATLYTILVVDALTRESFAVERRYSEFHALWDRICKAHQSADPASSCSNCSVLKNFIRSYQFPKKHLFSFLSKDKAIVADRARLLRSLVRTLSQISFSTPMGPAGSIRRSRYCDSCQAIISDFRRFIVDSSGELAVIEEKLESGLRGEIFNTRNSFAPHSRSTTHYSTGGARPTTSISRTSGARKQRPLSANSVSALGSYSTSRAERSFRPAVRGQQAPMQRYHTYRGDESANAFEEDYTNHRRPSQSFHVGDLPVVRA